MKLSAAYSQQDCSCTRSHVSDVWRRRDLSEPVDAVLAAGMGTAFQHHHAESIGVPIRSTAGTMFWNIRSATSLSASLSGTQCDTPPILKYVNKKQPKAMISPTAVA